MSLPVKNVRASHVIGDAWHGSAGVSVNVEVPISDDEHSFSCPHVSLTGNSQLDAGRTGEGTLGSELIDKLKP